jgi:hypothetical protein
MTDATKTLSLDGDTPSSIVCTLPVEDLAGRRSLPFLLAEDETGDVHVVAEVLAWASASSYSRNLSTIQRDVEIVGRFYNFCRAFTRGMTISEDDLDYLIYAYLLWRLNGTLTDEGRSIIPGLRWKPLSVPQLEQEFHALARYFAFCSKQFGYVTLNSKAYRQAPDSAPIKRLDAQDAHGRDDFLIHLGASRDFWSRRIESTNPLIPPIVSMRRPSAKRGIRMIMAEEEIWAVIETEKNPVFRAIWLLAAFGGPRISEQLNLWQCDILPASYHLPLLGYAYTETSLVIKADPLLSRYTGDISKPGVSRGQYIQDRYSGRIQPRPQYERGHPLRAGWKAMLYVNSQLKLAPTFWIGIKAASLFDECAAEIRDFHLRHATSRLHPFFYVNVADPTGSYRGQPTKMSNVQDAWNRACRRSGLDPHRWGRNLHALRHHYKAYAEHELCMRPKYLQIMIGHNRLESQEDYGREAKRVHETLMRSPKFSHRIG